MSIIIEGVKVQELHIYALLERPRPINSPFWLDRTMLKNTSTVVKVVRVVLKIVMILLKDRSLDFVGRVYFLIGHRVITVVCSSGPSCSKPD